MRRLPRGLTEKAHDAARDSLLSLLLRLGYEVYGAWEDWQLEASEATKKQLWDDHVLPGERDFAWWLIYRGDNSTAREWSHAFGSRYLIKDVLSTFSNIENVWHHFSTRNGTISTYVGAEFTPGDGRERPMPEMKLRRVSVLTYACEKCGREWTKGRSFKHEMIHRADGGKLILKSHEKK